MAIYKIPKLKSAPDYVETSVKGVVKCVTSDAFKWAVGKPLAKLTEWCSRKHMPVEPVNDAKERNTALNQLHPQGSLL